MKTYSVVIDFKMPDDIPDSMFDGLDGAFANVICDAGGELLNISDYVELDEDIYE